MDIEKIGQFIKKLRVEKELSQNQLADMIPISRQAISSWENGKSLPNSDTLIILGKIFNVTVDELLSGGEEKSNIEEIALNLVDEYNSKGKKLKRTVRIFIITTILLMFFIFSYYFITSYNSIKVYKIDGQGDNFYTNRGILIVTKEKSYLQIGEIFSNRKKEAQQYKLYYLDKNKKKHTLYRGKDSNILIRNYYGYDEYFPYKDIKNVMDKLYLEIEFDNKKEIIKLKLKQDFINGFLSKNKNDKSLTNRSIKSNDSKSNLNSIKEAKDVIASETPTPSPENQPITEKENQQELKEEKIINNSKENPPTIIVEDPEEEKSEIIDLPTEIDKVMKEKGQNISGRYIIRKKEENKSIEFSYMDKELFLEIKENENRKTWDYILDGSNLIFYSEFTGIEEKDNRYIMFSDIKELKDTDKIIYDELIEYITKYILEK